VKEVKNLILQVSKHKPELYYKHKLLGWVDSIEKVDKIEEVFSSVFHVPFTPRYKYIIQLIPKSSRITRTIEFLAAFRSKMTLRLKGYSTPSEFLIIGIVNDTYRKESKYYIELEPADD